ncbi:MAG: tyrosine-protein kinase [Solirubrobacteraceae bacterium]|jgi:Mrp family chromosome partitioning ATPase|nr:tyrosine-protein kinase [Solirubrobacteraceae bacterium]
MSSDGHDPTIRDYLRELRQQRWLILAVTVIAALLGLGYSVAQSTSYSATATVAVRDPNQDLTVLGSPGASNQSPLQLADAHAQRVNRLLVAQRAKADLGGEGPALEQLQKSIDVSVDPTSSLVSIAAKAHTATLAAAIANAFAREDVNQSTIEARQTYAQAARRLSQKIGPPGRTQQATRALYGEQLSRLQALSSFARPAEVSQLAAVPSSPSAPRPVRNTLAAALFGLMLGFAVAHLRHSLDRRLRTSDEIERHLELPLLGHVRREAMGRAGGLPNGLGPTEEADLEASRILRQNLQFLSVDRLRTIVVTSALPQEGKSTVAASLALANAAAAKKTLLIECDLRRPVLAQRLGLDSRPGLTDYMFDLATLDEVLQTVAAAPQAASNGSMPHLPPRVTDSGPARRGSGQTGVESQALGILTCITAGTPAPRPAELLASEKFAAFLSEMSGRFDVIILDSSPILSVVDTLELVPQVAGVLVCVRAFQTTRDQAAAALAALRRMPERPTGLVVTGVRAGAEAGYAYYYSYASSETT